jgi:low temperature requirement protein LtrA
MSDAVVTHAEGRKATWFELFFDLVFVTAVAALTGQFAEHYTLQGAAQFAFLLLILWWLWLGNTFHATRFDKDRPDQWVLGFIQMIAVVFIAYGAGDAFGARGWAFAGGVAAFKLLLALAYLREWREGLQRLCTLYAAIYAVQTVLFAISIWLAPDTRPWLWAAALLLDVVSPFIVARETHRAPPHPEHLPERFGLFTIILLGETAAAAVHALDHGSELHGDTLVVALCGALAGFLFWVGYFRRAAGHGERHVHDARSAAMLRLWAYGHIPLYLGIGALGAGTVYLSHHADAHGAAPWVYAGGVALGMLGVTVVSLARNAARLTASWRFVPVILIMAALPAFIHHATVLAVSVVILSSLQIGISFWPTTK